MFRALARGVNSQGGEQYGFWLDLSSAVYVDGGYVNTGSAWADLESATYFDGGYVNTDSAWADLSAATYVDGTS